MPTYHEANAAVDAYYPIMEEARDEYRMKHIDDATFLKIRRHFQSLLDALDAAPLPPDECTADGDPITSTHP